ncbi:MAG: hypothetical protein RBR53_05635 [Desulforegulaceae bacterium]|nr:hypothetical protein [Desulforegulaceae bacterium]
MLISQFKKVILIFICLTGFFSVPGFSETNNSIDRQSTLKFFQEYKTLHQQIQEIQKPIIDKSPKLQSQIKEISEIVTKTWGENAELYNVDIEKLTSLEEKIKNKELAQEEKNKFMAEYKEESHKFYKAKQATLTDDKIRTLQSELEEKLKKETIKSNPDSAKIYLELEKVKKKIVDLQKTTN